MDGTEFRFVKDITRNWQKTFNLRDSSRTNHSPYEVLPNDLLNGTSDMAMCSIWLLEKNYKRFDLTTFYDEMCSTFLVPKPKKLNEAIAIYTALQKYVWMLFLSVLLMSIIALSLITKIERSLSIENARQIDLSHAILETIAIVSSLPIYRLPSNSQVSAKILLIRQFFFNLISDTAVQL